MEKIGLEGVFKTEAFRQGMKIYTDGLKGAEGQTQSTAKILGGALAIGAGIAMAAIAALTAVVLGAAVGFTKLVFSSAIFGEKIAAMSAVTGVSIERLQELTYAGKLLDVDIETITSGLRFLTRNMYSAREGTGEQADAFKQLGVNIIDTNGQLRDADTVFGEVLDALGKIENPTLVDAIAMKLMGRSAMELNPLIKAGSGLLAQYSAQAHKMGAVLSTDAIERFDKFQDEMEAMKLTGQALKATLGSALLPVFQAILDIIGKIVSGERFQNWFKTITDNVMKTTTHLAEFLSRLFGIQDVVENPPAPTTAPQIPEGYTLAGTKGGAGTDLAYVKNKGTPEEQWLFVPQNAPGTTPTARNPNRTLMPEELPQPFIETPFEQAIGGFVDALKTVDWKDLANQLKGLAGAIADIDWIKFANDMITVVGWLAKILNVITTEPTKSGHGVGETIDKLVSTSPVEQLKGGINAGVQSVTDWFGSLFAGTGGTAESAGGTVQKWSTDFSNLIQQFLNKVFGIGDGTGTPKSKMEQNGKDMVAGLSQGYTDEWTIFSGKAKTAAQNLLDDINEIYGVGSPSKEFYKTGVNLVKGLEEGIMRSLSKLAPSIPLVFSTGEAGKSSKNTTYNVTINNPTMQNATTSINQTLKNLNYLSSV